MFLKYSSRTALTASGIDSSFRAFRSCSRAFTISSDIATIILFIAKGYTLVIGIHSKWLTLIQKASQPTKVDNTKKQGEPTRT